MFKTGHGIDGHTACERSVEECAYAVNVRPRTLSAVAACGILFGSGIALEKLILQPCVDSSCGSHTETAELQLALIVDINGIGADSTVDYACIVEDADGGEQGREYP